MPSLLDLLLQNQDQLTVPNRPVAQPFPRNAAGQLVNPLAVQIEGQRIRDSLAAGTYGAQPEQAAAGNSGQITIAPASSTVNPSDSFFFQPSMWEQNRDPAQLRQDLRLDELRTNAAAKKFELERAMQTAPVLDQLALAKLAHEQAATDAVGATNLRQIRKDETTMRHVAGFENYMTNAPDPGSVEYDRYVRAGVAKYPAILTTKYGASHIPKIGQEHDLAAMAKQFGGDVASVTVGPNGPSVTIKPTGGDIALEKAAEGFGLSLARIRNPVGAEVGRRGRKGEMINGKSAEGRFIGDESGDTVRVEDSKGQMVSIPAKEYERLGGTFSPQTLAARGGNNATGSNTPVQVNTIEEANALPSGTMFLTPTGQLKRKP